MSSNVVCIYHKHCNDGFAAALAVYLKHPYAEFTPMQYGEHAPHFVGKDVIVVDFSFKRQEVLDLKERANSLIIIDHHKSSQKELSGLPYCIFDMERSGCVLAWQHYHPGKALPELFRYIQDRDLWLFELPETEAVCAALALIPSELALWEPLINDEQLAMLIERGSIIREYQKICVARSIKKAVVQKFLGYTVPVINCTHLISEVGNVLCKEYPFAVMYFDERDRRVFSLRSDEGGIDVSVIAAHNGGGGHRHAAAFSVKRKNGEDYLQTLNK